MFLSFDGPQYQVCILGKVRQAVAGYESTCCRLPGNIENQFFGGAGDDHDNIRPVSLFCTPQKRGAECSVLRVEVLVVCRRRSKIDLRLSDVSFGNMKRIQKLSCTFNSLWGSNRECRYGLYGSHMSTDFRGQVVSLPLSDEGLADTADNIGEPVFCRVWKHFLACVEHGIFRLIYISYCNIKIFF